MYAIMGNPLKKIILLSLILYTPLCYDLFTQPIREAPLFSMTSRKMQEWESNQKPYISHKSTKPQVPQEGVQHSHPSLIEGAPVLWALGFETLVKEVPHKSQWTTTQPSIPNSWRALQKCIVLLMTTTDSPRMKSTPPVSQTVLQIAWSYTNTYVVFER